MSVADYFAPGRLFAMMAMFSLGVVAIYAEAAPLGIDPVAMPSPDLLLCVVAYWSLRRPDAAPMLSIFALALLRDFLTDQPAGAGALTLVLASEVLKRARQRVFRDGFGTEWIVVTGAAFATSAALWLVVLLSLSQPPYLSDVFYQCLFTALAYPGIALVLRWLMRIRWQRPEPAR